LQQNHPIPEEEYERPLPRNLEAEQAILGSILLDQQPSLDAVQAAKLKPSAFAHDGHRRIFQVMLDLEEAGDPIDLITLTTKLQEKGWLSKVGGITYITDFASSVPSAANIESYIKLVSERHTQRQLIEHARLLEEQAWSSADSEQTISSSREKLDQLSDHNIKKGFRSAGDISVDYFEELEHRYLNRDGTGVTGITSGYPDLDKMTAGFQKSDLIIVAARPSVGKTAFALNIARNAASDTKETIGVFSLEMSEKQLIGRMISSEGNTDASRLRSAHLVGEDWEKVAMAIGNISDYPIYIDDTPGITINEIRAKARKLKAEKGLGMIIIDYLQLIEVTNRSGSSNRQQEVSEISRTLKKIAKELDVPIIALSQLSRGVEQRQDKRPILSDLRESGSIEQDADIVAFLYRDDYYDKESEKKNIIEIIISKQRNGPTGTVELVFMKNTNKFISIDHSQYEHSKSEPSKSSFKKPDMYSSR
jgi:replicative DNA helicase